MRGPQQRRRAVAAVLAACLLAPAAACTDGGPDEGEGRLELADQSRARIVRQDGAREEVDADVDVATGDQVTLLAGTGRLELPDDTVLELRAGLADRADTVLVMAPRPVLENGDLLIVTEDRFTLAADDTAVAVSQGGARVSRAVGIEVASYTAAVHLDSAGQQRDLPALREMQVPALGLPPEAPRAIQYDPADPWDRRFLGEAVELGGRLEALSAGYTQNLGEGAGRTVAFYRAALPGLVDESGLTEELLAPAWPPGETLVGAAIAQLGRRGTFAERWRSVFEFRALNANWGFVALDQGVDRAALLAAVTDAVEDTPLAIAPPPAGPGGPGAPGGPAGPGGAGGPGGTGGSGSGGQASPTTPTTGRPSAPSPGPTTTTVPPPMEERSEGLLPPILGPIVDPVTDLLSGLVRGLLGSRD